MKNCKLRAQRSKVTLQANHFLSKFEKLKKGPLRGTPHNLSKVSLEVRELKIKSNESRKIPQQSLRLQVKSIVKI